MGWRLLPRLGDCVVGGAGGVDGDGGLGVVENVVVAVVSSAVAAAGYWIRMESL